MKKSLNLIGASGEYFICAEICRLGYFPLLTSKNNFLFDVIAINDTGTKSVSIQVKTRSISNKQGWKLGKEITNKQNNKSLFTVLVNFKPEGDPDFYIYEYDDLAKRVQNVYQDYIKTPKRDGSACKSVSFLGSMMNHHLLKLILKRKIIWNRF